jgi:hypothetical protein
MKKLILLSIVFVTLLTGCKKEAPETKTPSTEIAKPVEQPTTTTCYSFEEKGSSVSIQMEITGNDVTGTMVYALAEKDKNTGTFKGTLNNDILIADYTFQSEGVESTRQVAFEIRGDQLIEGYGEMNDDGTQFKDVNTLKFNATMPLRKIPCPE